MHQVSSQPGFHSEFQVSLAYSGRLRLKTLNESEGTTVLTSRTNHRAHFIITCALVCRSRLQTLSVHRGSQLCHCLSSELDISACSSSGLVKHMSTPLPSPPTPVRPSSYLFFQLLDSNLEPCSAPGRFLRREECTVRRCQCTFHQV